jgi:uncharacterized protein (TIGR02421 family)
MIWSSYKEKIKHLSESIVELQKPIHVLNSIKWDHSIESEFFATKAKELPKVDAAFYGKSPLGFDPIKKRQELKDLGAEIERQLGHDDDLGQLMLRMVEEYSDITLMLEGRGGKRFYEVSRKLYGSPKDNLFGGQVSISDQGHVLYELLSGFENKFLGRDYPKEIPSTDVVRELNARFAKSFLQGKIEVVISDGLVADAAAGADKIKIKENAKFSRKDIDIFEVHEGWVHVGTTLNGKAQRIAKFLSKGPPCCAATQEGLAILMEILTFSTYPLRARTINDRILGIEKAEDGADFLDLYDFYLVEGYTEIEAYRNAMRVFRGGDVRGGAPFTKDISYCKGFVENYNFIRTAIRKGRPEIVPFMFAGKLHVDDVPLLYQKSQEGIINAPELLPPHFKDLNGLAVWMSFSNFLNGVDMKLVTSYYDSLFQKYL